jgi:hypothetical protein
MDERNIQEKGKDREGWGKEKNINVWNCYFYFVKLGGLCRDCNRS